MDPKDYDLRLIEGHFDGSLNDSEKKTFEDKIKNSKEFAEQFRLAQSVMMEMESQYKNEKKKSLRSIYEKTRKEPHGENQPRKPGQKYFYWAAAAVLIIAGSLYLLNGSRSTTEEIFLTFYEPYPAYPEVRGGEASDVKKTMEFYRSGKYKKAVPGFEKQLEIDESKEVIYLFLGNCFLNTDELKSAIDNFKLAQKSSDPIISQHASWYLALSYLREKNIAEATKILESILVKGESQLYHKQAKSILESL